mmetsp:Transcript_34214/g.70497  ORF Transcript_34214/g.70497 Transcript_34214/m.70497 type:complete len:321 (+) Transcript_34214:485-1447(+)
MDSWHVVLLHLSHAGELAAFWHLVQLDGPGHRHALAQVGKPHFDELLRVQGTVPVAALADRPGKHHSRRVDRLPDILPVHPARDLLDEDWGQALRSQLLMHAEKIDLHHLDRLVIYPHLCGNAGDEANKLATALDTHAKVPVPQKFWRLQRPAQEVNGVVEAEHAVVIFDVILCQEGVDFLHLGIIIHIAGTPFKLPRQWIRLRAYIVDSLELVQWSGILIILGAHGGNRLGVPEGMLSCRVSPGLLAGAPLSEHLQKLCLGVGLGLTLLAVVGVSRWVSILLSCLLRLLLILCLLVLLFLFLLSLQLLGLTLVARGHSF